MTDDIETLRTALTNCADSLEEELKARYGDPIHPALLPKWFIDMQDVYEAREATAALERVDAERDALREKLRKAREALNDAANIAIRIPAQHLGMNNDQRVYSWHDVMDGLSKAMTAIRARATLAEIEDGLK